MPSALRIPCALSGRHTLLTGNHRRGLSGGPRGSVPIWGHCSNRVDTFVSRLGYMVSLTRSVKMTLLSVHQICDPAELAQVVTSLKK